MSSAEIYTLLAVLGFLVFSGCAIYLVMAIVRFFNAMTQSILSLDEEPKKFFSQANELTENVNHKMKCLDPLFHSVSNIGQGVEYRTQKFKSVREETKMDQAIEVAALIINALELVQKFKKKG